MKKEALQSALQARMIELLEEERDNNDDDLLIVQSGIRWSASRGAWVLVLFKQCQQSLKVYPYKEIAL
jgi:hypothetical protein